MGSYSRLMSKNNPGMILILLDQSGAMASPMGNGDKETHAALVVNRVIFEILQGFQKGDDYNDSCYIGVIGYGATVELIVGGMVTEVANNPIDVISVTQKVEVGAGGLIDLELRMPVWVAPVANNGTPMAEALTLAHDLAERWIAQHPNCFPPVVYNLCSGLPDNRGDTKNRADELKQLASSDGQLLLFNHLLPDFTEEAIIFPATPSSLNETERFYFAISSEIPQLMVARRLIASGIPVSQGSRGFSKGDPELMWCLIQSIMSVGVPFPVSFHK